MSNGIAHPDWRLLADAQAATGMRMIEAPEVEVAGFRIGSVWFTERFDENFRKFMAQMMDKRGEGVVGGEVFRHFRTMIDDSPATAWVECVRDCKSIP